MLKIKSIPYDYSLNAFPSLTYIVVVVVPRIVTGTRNILPMWLLML